MERPGARHPANRGFTLIELMVTVAIVGILSSIAIPQYGHFLLRAKRAELPLNLDGVRAVEIGYHAEWDVFTSCALLPEELPGRTQVDFGTSLYGNLDWNHMGWTPDGKVYGQYETTASDEQGFEASFEANVYSDIDGDGNVANYRTTNLVKPTLMTPNTIY